MPGCLPSCAHHGELESRHQPDREAFGRKAEMALGGVPVERPLDRLCPPWLASAPLGLDILFIILPTTLWRPVSMLEMRTTCFFRVPVRYCRMVRFIGEDTGHVSEGIACCLIYVWFATSSGSIKCTLFWDCVSEPVIHMHVEF
eukprot:1152411-Pelagomonas_calceolata.AAC.2